LKDPRRNKELIIFDGTYRLKRREDISSKDDRNWACSWRLRLFDFSVSHSNVKHLKPYAVVATQTGDGIFKTTCAESLGKRICKDFDLNIDEVLWIEHYPNEQALYVAMFKPKSYFGNEIFYAIDWRPIRPNELHTIQPFNPEVEQFRCM
ncbi:MAG: hypothetical protein P8012_17305, partial [Desulfobacterales bacterium]